MRRTSLKMKTWVDSFIYPLGPPSAVTPKIRNQFIKLVTSSIHLLLKVVGRHHVSPRASTFETLLISTNASFA